MASFITNGPYSNRIQMTLDSLTGPLSSTVLGPFAPLRDLSVYLDGVRLTIQTSYFDPINNRYLIFMNKVFNLEGLIQVFHHMPNPNFLDINNQPLDAFSEIATFTPDADSVSGVSGPPTVKMVVFPGIPQVNQALTFLVEALNVDQVELTASDGFSSGMIDASAELLAISKPLGFASSGSFTTTLTGFDIHGVQIGSSFVLNITVTSAP
jgi:hypothetical protein